MRVIAVLLLMSLSISCATFPQRLQPTEENAPVTAARATLPGTILSCAGSAYQYSIYTVVGAGIMSFGGSIFLAAENSNAANKGSSYVALSYAMTALGFYLSSLGLGVYSFA